MEGDSKHGKGQRVEKLPGDRRGRRCFTFSQLYGDADPAGPVSVASGNSISRQLQTGWNSKNLSSNSDLTVCGWNEQNGTFQAKISNSRL